MKQLSLAIALVLFLITVSCGDKTGQVHSIESNQSAQSIQPVQRSHEFASKRLAAITLTDFLAVGEKLDTLSKDYSSLKYDSIEAINFMYIGMADNFKKDTILNRHSLDTMHAKYLVEVLDSQKTYDYNSMSKCFEPHTVYVFYSQDTIVARCSICFHCGNLFSTVRTEERRSLVNLSQFGKNTLRKMCNEFKFADCQ
jgi:hypothetical protein